VDGGRDPAGAGLGQADGLVVAVSSSTGARGAEDAAGRAEPAGRAKPAGHAEPEAGAEPAERRPVSVYGVGDEPDPRFSLANERTALAWMRTALALVGGGVALISVASLATLPKWSALIGAAVCIGGALLAWRAVTGWARVERALRLGERLPAPRALVWLAGGVVLPGALTLALTILELVRR
jgi:putative membrane protein